MGMAYIDDLREILKKRCGGCTSCHQCRSCDHDCKANRAGRLDDEVPVNYWQLHLTGACNLRCSHCYHEDYSSARDLTKDQWLAVVRGILAMCAVNGNSVEIGLTGGEPFLRLDVIEGIDYVLAGSGVRYDILTNGTMIDEKACQWLAGLSVARVQVSLDGASPAVHDEIRGLGAWDAAMNALRLLRHHGIKTSIMFTVNNVNAKDAVPIHSLAEGLGVDALGIERWLPGGQSLKSGLVALSAQDLSGVYQQVIDWRDAHGWDARGLYRPLWALADAAAGGMCSAGLSGGAILEDGTVLACRRLPIPLGNAVTGDLQEIWADHPVLKQLRSEDASPGCLSCEHVAVCRGCRAAAYLESGDLAGVDPQCWVSDGHRRQLSQ